jgi:hypothetical protein
MAKNFDNIPASLLDLKKLPSGEYKQVCASIFDALVTEIVPQAEPTEIPNGVAIADAAHMHKLYPAQYLNDHNAVTFRMYNVETGALSDYSYQYWKMRVDKKTHDERVSRAIAAVFEYDPYDPAPLKEVVIDRAPASRFNLYKKPSWMDLEYSGQLPELAKKFFSHMFPDPKCRSYIYTWMHRMLTTRSEIYLYLPAPKDTGKTTFAYLCGALVGHDNFELAKSDFAENHFNAFVANRRLILLDEYNCWSNNEKDTLKRIINDRIQIEAKGQDQKTVTNYSSFIICNNNNEGIFIEPDDRRFSIPEVTREKISDHFTAEELAELNAEIESECSQFIADIGHWILQNFEGKYSKRETPWHKERFEEIVFSSAREGMKYIIDQIVAKKAQKYTYAKLRAEYRSLVGRNVHFPPHFKVREYINGLKMDGRPIATCSWDGVTLTIIPEPRYCPDKKDDEF